MPDHVAYGFAPFRHDPALLRTKFVLSLRETWRSLQAHAPLPFPAVHALMPPGLRMIPRPAEFIRGFHAPLPGFHRERANLSCGK